MKMWIFLFLVTIISRCYAGRMIDISFVEETVSSEFSAKCDYPLFSRLNHQNG